MEREEFVERNQKLLDQIEAIQCEILNLETAYVNSQVKIPVGSKIIISTPVKYLDKEGNIIRESFKTREALSRLLRPPERQNRATCEESPQGWL